MGKNDKIWYALGGLAVGYFLHSQIGGLIDSIKGAVGAKYVYYPQPTYAYGYRTKRRYY